MKDIIERRFHFEFENDSSASYLVLGMSSNENILEYQVEMINNNPCPGILRLDTRYKNNEMKLYYSITSKLVLSQFLQRKKLSRGEFIDILRGITKVLLDSKEYFLYDKSFLIDEDYIYINPSTLEIGLIYVPIVFDADASENFKSFLINLIISLAKIDENSSGNFMQKILNYLKNDIFNILDFDKLLRDLKNNKSKMSSSKISEIKQTNLQGLNTENSNQNKDTYSKPIYEENHVRKPISHKELYSSKASDRKEIEPEHTTFKKRYKPKFILMAVVIQVIIAIVLAFSIGAIKSFAGDDISVYGGIAIIVVAIDVLLFKSLFKKENMEEIKETKKIRESKTVKQFKKTKGRYDTQPTLKQEKHSINMTKREIYNVNEPKNINKECDEAAAGFEPAEIISINANETEFLDDAKQELAYLQRMNNGIMDKVTITKTNFIIGRLPNYVDYLIENNAIGRTHAEILCKDRKYFIKDLNSKNGTFVNGIKIDSNKEYQVNDGDRVKLANVEFTFIL